MAHGSQILEVNRTKRNYGIDLLRLVSMFMVVILHILLQGGILKAATGIRHSVAWLIEIFAACAVNCFAMISGYVSYSETPKPYRYSKFLDFWLQVFTYNFGIAFIVFLVRPGVIGAKGLIRFCFPVASKAYWYASAYAGLFFVIPWLNHLLRTLSKKQSTALVLTITAVFSVYSTFFVRFDCFELLDGYSFAWLVILYIVGAWMKKCDIPSRLKSGRLIAASLFCLVFSWAIHEFIKIEAISEMFVRYVSITIVFVAFSLVCVFSKMKFKTVGTKLTSFFAPAAFGVYLIHVHELVFEHLMKRRFEWIAGSPAWLIPLQVLGIAFCIFAVCLLIEKIRLLLFRLVGINKLLSIVEKKIDTVLEKATRPIMAWIDEE